MSGTLGTRLASARDGRFVGRARELEAFAQAVRSDAGAVFAIWGPGGIGKSTLLQAFAGIAREHGHQPRIIDARDIEPSPGAFLESAGGGSDEGRVILLVDTAELLGNLGRWLTSTFLPSLPSNAIVAIAGRNPPPTEWRTDPGWSALVAFMPLRNFDAEESKQFLAGRGVPGSEHARATSLTYGHPLALALLADLARQHPDWSSTVPTLPRDAVSELVDVFLESAPTEHHRDALYLLAHARATTEELVAEALGADRARETFEWLTGLSFVTETPDGVVPHDLARDALDLDLRWRSPAKFREVHMAVRNWVIKRILRAGQQFAAPIFIDLLFLHRHNPLMASFTSVREAGRLYLEPAREDDREAILRWTEEFEGEESRGAVEFWWSCQREGFQSIRDLDGRIVGYCAGLRVTGDEPGAREADPVYAAAFAYINQVRPLRPGEHSWLFRHWIYPPAYQAPSPAMDLIYGWTTMIWLTSPGIAWTFVIPTDGDAWEPVLNYLYFERAPASFDTTLGKMRYTLIGHDWRIQPPTEWLDAMGERELLTTAPGNQRPQAAVQPVVLAEADFRKAARAGIRDVRRPAALAANPLVRSRLAGGADAPAANLARSIEEAASELRANPRDERLYRVFHRTYLEPAPTQEAAAELLDLPWSTYRRHLAASVERVIEGLWTRELSWARDIAGADLDKN